MTTPADSVRTLTIDAAGTRLDRALAAAWPDLSRTFLQRLLGEGRVTVNGSTPRASYIVRAGDQVVAAIPPPAPLDVAPEEMPLAVVYEDADLLVIDKPAGLVVHPAPGHPAGTLVNALLARCPDLAGIGGVQRPGIVHRLDKDTSGLIVVAKNQAAHDSLARQLRERGVVKRYLALVRGRPRAEQGEVRAPIGRDPHHRQRMAVVAGGREAASDYRVLETLGAWSLLEVTIHTGRTHQIRVHLAYLGHPVAGDPVYGGRGGPALPPGVRLDRQFLHAAVLGFRLPATGEYCEFRSELPQDLREVLAALRDRGQTHKD